MAEQRTLNAERAEFEAWALKCGFKPTTFSHRVGASYLNQYLEDYWTCWQAARRAPPVLDAEGLPELPKPVRMSADQAYLGYTAEQVRQAMRDAVAADRRTRISADQWAALEAAQLQLDAAKIERENRLARQSAPEGAPVCQAGTGDGQWLDIRPEDAETWRKIYYTVRTLYAPTSASAKPADQNKMEKNDE